MGPRSSRRSRYEHQPPAVEESIGQLIKTLAFLVLLPLLLAGCATALKRDGRCLASLTPDHLAAQDELQQLQDSWRALHRRQTLASEQRPDSASSSNPKPRNSAVAVPSQAEVAEAYARLLEARRRHQPTLDWYGKVYRRLQMRIEEDQLLTEVQTVLFPTPGVLFYPVIRWNVHSVMWDGENPDDEADPVTRFCAERLRTN